MNPAARKRERASECDSGSLANITIYWTNERELSYDILISIIYLTVAIYNYRGNAAGAEYTATKDIYRFEVFVLQLCVFHL